MITTISRELIRFLVNYLINALSLLYQEFIMIYNNVSDVSLL